MRLVFILLGFVLGLVLPVASAQAEELGLCGMSPADFDITPDEMKLASSPELALARYKELLQRLPREAAIYELADLLYGVNDNLTPDMKAKLWELADTYAQPRPHTTRAEFALSLGAIWMAQNTHNKTELTQWSERARNLIREVPELGENNGVRAIIIGDVLWVSARHCHSLSCDIRHGTSLETTTFLAKFLLASGQKDAALNEIRKAESIASSHPADVDEQVSHIQTLFSLYLRAHQATDARRLIRELQKLDPDALSPDWDAILAILEGRDADLARYFASEEIQADGPGHDMLEFMSELENDKPTLRALQAKEVNLALNLEDSGAGLDRLYMQAELSIYANDPDGMNIILRATAQKLQTGNQARQVLEELLASDYGPLGSRSEFLLYPDTLAHLRHVMQIAQSQMEGPEEAGSYPVDILLHPKMPGLCEKYPLFTGGQRLFGPSKSAMSARALSRALLLNGQGAMAQHYLAIANGLAAAEYRSFLPWFSKQESELAWLRQIIWDQW